MSAFVTPPCRASYPVLIEPRKVDPKGEPKYGIVLVFDDEHYDLIKSKVLEAGAEKFGDDFADLAKKPTFKISVHRDGEAKGYGENTFYVNCYSPNRPGAVHRFADPATGKPKKLTDKEIAELIYPGAQIRASIRFYGYKNVGTGIAAAINNVQWLGDAPRFDSRKAAEDEFEATEDTADIEVEAPAPAATTAKPSRRSRKADATDLSNIL